MARGRRIAPALAMMAVMGLLVAGVQAQTGDKPLGEQEIVTLLGLGIDADAVAARIKRGGVTFEVNDAALEKLRKAGAGNAVLAAVQAAAKSKSTAVPIAAVTYEQVLQLLTLGIDEAAILKRLEKSPTIFTLDAAQTEALKKAGASDTLLAAMAGKRAAPAPAGDITDLAIVLDCSGSMVELTTGRESKMAVAKRVVTDLVQKIPEGLNVTFVIYGHEVFGGAEDPRNCQAVKVARPLSPLDLSGKNELIQMIGGLQPTGATPIALSLRTAGQELKKNNALCGLVLLTDGLESCRGDPAAEAAALVASLKITFGVHVVGFGVKAEENAALKTIADAGKGTYYAAADATALTAAIAAIAQEIQKKAKPPDVVPSGRRAVKIVQPGVEFPAMKEVFLAEAGAEPNVVRGAVKGSINKYDEEIRIPSATAKYDIWWLPQDGMFVRMVVDFNLPERKVVEIKPEDYLGMVRVNGKGKTKQIAVVVAGTEASVRGASTIQQSKKFGETMVVPKGKYDVYVDDNLIEEGLEIQVGKLMQLE